MTGNDDPDVLLARLTPQRDKVLAYRGDTYVAETVDQLRGLGVDPAGYATGHSLLLLKPDAIVGRAVEPTLNWLGDNGYRVTAAEIVPVNRHLARALWYYAWNIASPERRRLADLLVRISDAMVLVVAAAEGPLPVPVRLARAKGPTDPRKRRPGELRHLLGRDNYLLNLVHTPDDPADVLRELAVYFPEPVRARIVAATEPAGERALALAAELYARTPERSFDREVALDRVLRDLAPPDFDRGSPEACAALLNRALVRGDAVDPWSAIVLGSQVLPMRVGTGAQTLPPVTAADWIEEFG